MATNLIEYPKDGSGPESIAVGALVANPSADVNWQAYDEVRHLRKELCSWVPRSYGGTMLDLGCGEGTHEGVARLTGHAYVGIDIDPRAGLVQGDAHALPFPDAAFEGILSIAALEHFRFPQVALREAHRVLVSGGWLVGTVAFLEPFHSRSYYHHSHLGLYDTLSFAGFADIRLFLNPATVAPSSLSRALFPGLPKRAQRWMTKPLLWTSWLWCEVLGRVKRRNYHADRLRATAGAFTFIARKA